jgi:hypothetical protein
MLRLHAIIPPTSPQARFQHGAKSSLLALVDGRLAPALSGFVFLHLAVHSDGH